LPLYVFCDQDALACVLRRSWREPVSVLSALFKLIAQRMRQPWPGVRAGCARRLALLSLEGTAPLRRVRQRPHHWAAEERRARMALGYAVHVLVEAYEVAGTKRRLIDDFTTLRAVGIANDASSPVWRTALETPTRASRSRA
jgi:hypothetical protein